MTPTPPINAQICPLCGQPNQCAMEVERATGVKQPPCWCTQTQFSAELLNKIPEAARGVACLCATCVNEATP
ncbi:MAG: cysteine-rich CWC family protein [Rhodoferax sp.]|uniref:cysteine-rich CWC family protein n=1 Tax=Rhodoferax sp. TaxID=50421 RepID=UPI002629D6A5|nr:cysteine-rich CWC family protein [Rhodoferax sp.]MDD2881173.1 cysteine-rich CWC family protein [Rhodoferax sp.]